VTRVFTRVGLSAPRPTPGYPGVPMFSVMVVSLSWLVPILKRQDLVCFALAWLSRINVAQEPWRGHAWNGLGGNKWHYSSFVSIHLSARCIPLKPRTTPSTPVKSYTIRNSFRSHWSLQVTGKHHVVVLCWAFQTWTLRLSLWVITAHTSIRLEECSL
jgi:hypothetical protein